jgi:hypothetical protein
MLPRARPAAVVLAVLSLTAVACDGDSTDTAPSSTRSTRSSVPANAATTTTRPRTTSTTATTAPPGSSTTPVSPTTGTSSTVRISGFSGPPSPVECNAQTMVELRWTTSGAATVEMHIDDGGVFATYPNGAHAELLPLTCDGNEHTYRLVARAGTSTSAASLTLSTKTPS